MTADVASVPAGARILPALTAASVANAGPLGDVAMASPAEAEALVAGCSAAVRR
ncbi:hypothetical protein [Streptomyces sp. MK7]|uniref:hypothetical protein n=1 Tax=Streptomyces sp. MK7 TaxID=3067635 RepID=UPI00292DCC79|nr:hypothetical protein [Streptomyces sp. MK7]